MEKGNEPGDKATRHEGKATIICGLLHQVSLLPRLYQGPRHVASYSDSFCLSMCAERGNEPGDKATRHESKVTIICGLERLVPFT